MKVITVKNKIIFLLLIVFLLAGCSNKKESIGKTIDLDINSCKIEKQVDTHGGFLGDGDYFARIKCLEREDLSNKWKELPLSKEISKVMEIKFCDGSGCKDVYEKYSIPKIKNGYYYFYDRHSSSKNRYDDTDLNTRSSWNFSLAILDLDTNIIYYYELDT